MQTSVCDPMQPIEAMASKEKWQMRHMLGSFIGSLSKDIGTIKLKILNIFLIVEDMDFNVDFMMMQCRAKLNLAREDGRDQARCEWRS